MTETQKTAKPPTVDSSYAGLSAESLSPEEFVYKYEQCCTRQGFVNAIKQRDEQIRTLAREQAIEEAIEDLLTSKSNAGVQNDRITCRYCDLAIDALNQMKTPKHNGASQ